ncbi:MAG: EamA family transporter RarD [Desulfovibrionaceae bacterium]
MALSAFLLWGLLPVYWKSLQVVPPLELLCHRMVWSVPFTALILTLQGRWGETLHALRALRTVGLLLVSSAMICINWYLYIWAVTTGHVVESSLGYFINPLVNVLLGVIFFRDRLNQLQCFAILLAIVGVGYSIVGYGSIPWLSLGLAFSFGFYGLVRKLVKIAALPGLFVETLLLGIPAGIWLVRLYWQGQGAFLHVSPSVDLLLLCAGAVTSVPLMAFAGGARRLTLTTLGTLQYLAPTCAFLLGVFLYGEPFDTHKLVAFLFIWGGVAVYVADGIRSFSRIPRGPETAD